VVLQVGSQYATEYDPFLELSYVAEGFGIRIASMKLRSWVDSIRPGEVRLTAEAADRLLGATNGQGTLPLRLAIEMIEKQYLRPE